MYVPGGGREIWKVELGLMRGMHETAIGVADCDWLKGGAFVDYWGLYGAEVGGASGIGDERSNVFFEWDWCGRT